MSSGETCFLFRYKLQARQSSILLQNHAPVPQLFPSRNECSFDNLCIWFPYEHNQAQLLHTSLHNCVFRLHQSFWPLQLFHILSTFALPFHPHMKAQSPPPSRPNRHENIYFERWPYQPACFHSLPLAVRKLRIQNNMPYRPRIHRKYCQTTVSLLPYFLL